MKILIFVVFVTLFSCSTALVHNLTQCNTVEKPIENLDEMVTIGACRKPPCRLRKNSIIQFQMKLKPEKDVEKLTNRVFAYIVGVPFPFIGYDGTDACSNLFKSDGKTKVGCPLKAGEEYVYKNGIDVLEIYPRVKVVVHWGLTKEDDKDLLCFEVPARITK